MVDSGIDTGEVIMSKLIPAEECISMISFYYHVFERFPDMLVETISLLETGKRSRESVEITSSYHSFPTRREHLKFSAKGGKVILLKDIRYAWEM